MLSSSRTWINLFTNRCIENSVRARLRGRSHRPHEVTVLYENLNGVGYFLRTFRIDDKARFAMLNDLR